MKKCFSIPALASLALGFSCSPGATNSGKHSVLSPESGNNTTIHTDSTGIDTQWVNDREFRLIQNRDTIEIYRKTRFDKTYDDFPARLFTGRKAFLNYKSHRIAREYKTVITQQYKGKEVNFAGHYIIAHWGCGAPCSDLAIIDVKTGTVFYPELMNLGNFNFRQDSRLFILDPPDSLGWYPTVRTFSSAPRYYLWENNRMNEIRIDGQ